MPTLEEIEAELKRREQGGDRLTAIQAELKRRGVNTDAPEPPLYEKLWNSVKGNASEDLPDLFGSQFAEQAKNIRASRGQGDLAGSAKLSGAAMFGDDNDLLNAFRREFPDATLEADDNGNPIVRMPDGQRYYVNQPGLDMNDTLRFTGKAMSFLPAARVAGGMSTLLGKVGVGAALAGGTDVAMQVAAQRDKIDPAQTATAAAFGGGSEFVAPWLSKGVSAVANKFRPDGEKVKIGQQIAQKAGIQLNNTDDAIALYMARNQIEAGASPAAILAEQKYGFQLSQGQKTGNQSLLDYEDFLRQQDPSPGNSLVTMKDYNQGQMDRVNQGMRSMLARGEPAALEQDSARVIQQGLRDAEKAGRAKVSAAYRAADATGKKVYAAADDFAAIPGNIDKAFRGKVALSPELTPATLGARKILGEAAEDTTTAVSLKNLEELRKRLNVLRGSATKDTDIRAMSALMSEFDDQVGAAIARNFMDAGPEALTKIEGARKLASQMFRMFDGNKPSGRAILKSMADEATPEQVANFFLGANGINSAQASAVAKRYLSIVGKDSPQANALRDLVARRLFVKGGDARQTADMTVKVLSDALDGKGNTLMSSLFNKTELTILKDYQTILRDVMLPPKETLRSSVGRSSGTAERLVRWLSKSGLRKLPIGADMLQGLSIRLASNAAVKPLPVRPSAVVSLPGQRGLDAFNAVPAAAVAAGVEANDKRRY